MNRWLLKALGILALAVLANAPALAADTVYYYYTDTLHSAAAITDASGNVVERTYYAPYGQVLNRSLRDGPAYSGQYEDPVTGLDYIMQQRYYDPTSGRFVSTDPVGVAADGGNFNRYWYANDNPYRYTDPFGLCTGSPDNAGPCTVKDLSSRSVQAINEDQNAGGYRAASLENTIIAAANGNEHVNPNTLVGMGVKESSLNSNKRRPGGMYQIHPAMAKQLGLKSKDLSNITTQVKAAAKYLSTAATEFKSDSDPQSMAIASWTMGEGGAEHAYKLGGMAKVRSAPLSPGDHNPGAPKVGANYIDAIESYWIH